MQGLWPIQAVGGLMLINIIALLRPYLAVRYREK
jgi:hypothetical protein